MSKLILSAIKMDMEKIIPRTINGVEIAFFLGFDNSIDGHPVIRIEMKLYGLFSYTSKGRSFSIIPYDENLAEHEGYKEYMKEKIEFRVKEMIFGLIEFLNKNKTEEVSDESK